MGELLIGGAVLLGARLLQAKLTANQAVTLVSKPPVRLLTDAQIMALHAPRGGWDGIPHDGKLFDRIRSGVLETLTNGQIDIAKAAGVCAGKIQGSSAELKALSLGRTALIMSTKFISATQPALAGASLGAFTNPIGAAEKAASAALAGLNSLQAGTGFAQGVGQSLGIPGVLGVSASFATIAIFGVGIAITILGFIFTHHAKQVALERAYTCAGLPAANDAFAAIEKAVQDQSITPTRGISALDTLASDWNSKIIRPAASKGVFKDSGDQRTCDALCTYNYLVLNLIEKNKNRYAALAAEVG